jgi:hypothetical protein
MIIALWFLVTVIAVVTGLAHSYNAWEAAREQNGSATVFFIFLAAIMFAAAYVLALHVVELAVT